MLQLTHVVHTYYFMDDTQALTSLGKYKLGLVISRLEEYPNSDTPDPEKEDEGVWLHLDEYYQIVSLLKEIHELNFSSEQSGT